MLSQGILEIGKYIFVFKNGFPDLADVKPTVNKNRFDFIYWLHRACSRCVHNDIYGSIMLSNCKAMLVLMTSNRNVILILRLIPNPILRSAFKKLAKIGQFYFPIQFSVKFHNSTSHSNEKCVDVMLWFHCHHQGTNSQPRAQCIIPMLFLEVFVAQTSKRNRLLIGSSWPAAGAECGGKSIHLPCIQCQKVLHSGCCSWRHNYYCQQRQAVRSNKLSTSLRCLWFIVGNTQ